MADKNSEVEIYIPQSLKGIVDIIVLHKSNTPCHFLALPNSKVELLFLLQDSELERFYIDKNKSQLLPNDSSQFVIGLSSQTRPIEASYKNLNAINVVMNPVAAMAILEIPASEIKDLHFEPTTLGNLNQLQDVLNNLPTFQHRARYLEKFLLARLNASRYSKQVLDKITTLTTLHTGGIPSIIETELNFDRLHYSSSHMRKLCNEWLGVTYNEYRLHKKFRKAMYALNYENHSLTEIANSLDFYDSAHFIRTFKRFTGMTPTAYRNSQKGFVPEFILLK